MRVCEKHHKRATEILVSKISGIEYDLCPECSEELAEILGEASELTEAGKEKIKEAIEEYEQTKAKRGRKKESKSM
jgi:hypothetical protein